MQLRWLKPVIVTLSALVIMTGCSKNESSQNTAVQAPASAGPLSNPTDFQLYKGSNVVSAMPYTQTVSASTNGQASALASGSGTYSGHRVIALSSASMTDLEKWLKSTESAPPNGYSDVGQAQHPAAVNMAAKYGVMYGVFRKPGTNTNAVVAVVDPSVTKTKLAFVLSMVDKYRMLPGPLKGRVESEVQNRTGYNLDQMTDPSSPVGLALEAIKTAQNSGQRAIVLVDATKQ